MKILTIKDLFKQAQKEIKKGNGDKMIMLSDDDEGNGYHACYYTFSPISEDLFKYCNAPNEFEGKDADVNKWMTLG